MSKPVVICATCPFTRVNRNNHLECRIIHRVVAERRPACSLHPRHGKAAA